MGARKVLSAAAGIVTAAGLLATAGAQAANARPSGRAAAQPAASGLTIRTVAGGPGGPGQASTVSIGLPCGLTWSGKTLLIGSWLVAPFGGGAIRAVSTGSGRLTDVAGAGYGGSSPDNTPAKYAKFTLACDAIIDHQGNVVFSDSSIADTGPRSRTGNQAIRVVPARGGRFYGQAMTAGRMYTIGGSGQFGFSGDGGPATAARIGTPLGLAVDSAGNIVVATAWPTGHIRVIAAKTGTFYGQAMTAGDIYTIAGSATATTCAAPGADGQSATSVLLGLTTWLTRRNEQVYPDGLRIDRAGNVVFTDSGCSGTVRVVAAKSGAFYGRAMTPGHIYTIAGGGTAGPGNGGPATKAMLDRPGGLSIDHAGNVVVAVTKAQAVRVIAAVTGQFYGQHMTAGHIYTLAGGNGTGGSGDGGLAGKARLDFPSAVAVDGQGNVAIADTSSMRVRLVADKTGTFYGQKMHAGRIYTIAGNGVISFSGDGGPATAARFAPGGLFQGLSSAADQAGDLLISDHGNGRLRFVPARTGTFFGRHMVKGDIRTLAGSNPNNPAEMFADYSCDSGFGQAGPPLKPCWVAFDQAGNAVLTTPDTVRVIPVRSGRFYGQAMTAGHVYVIGGGGKGSANGAIATAVRLQPQGLAIDSHGNILFDSGGRLRAIAPANGTFYGVAMKAGRIYLVGGDVQILAADSLGNAITTLGDRVEVLAGRTGTFYGLPMTAGHVYVIAGDGDATESGDGGPAISAGINPFSVAVDTAGNLLIGDAGSGAHFSEAPVIRVVAERTGTFYGQAMTAGDIYKIAGGGTSFADGIDPRSAEFAAPPQVTAGPHGSIITADPGLGQIRQIRQISLAG